MGRLGSSSHLIAIELQFETRRGSVLTYLKQSVPIAGNEIRRLCCARADPEKENPAVAIIIVIKPMNIRNRIVVCDSISNMRLKIKKSGGKPAFPTLSLRYVSL